MRAKKTALRKAVFFVSDRTEYPSLWDFTENVPTVRGS